MTASSQQPGSRTPQLILALLCSITAIWLGTFTFDAAARLLLNAYVRLNAELPDSTMLVVKALQAYAHWLGAALATLAIGMAAVRRPALAGVISTFVLSIALAALAVAALALAWPTGLCGELRPDWPWAGSGSAPGSAAECRGRVR